MKIALSKINVYGDGKTNHTQIIQAVLDDIKTSEIVFEEGEYLISSIKVNSNQKIIINENAIVTFIDDISLYPKIVRRFEGYERLVYQPLIYCDQEVNICIEGQGILNGNGHYWWQLYKDGFFNEVERAVFIGFTNSSNLKIKGITIKNSPSWTIHPLCCEDVQIKGVKIYNQSDSPNTDGINPESCNNVSILDNYIDVGDDCIALKAGVEKANERIPCSNIIIANNYLLHGHGGIVIGSEMSGTISDVVVSNCVFDGTDRGIRIKTRRGRGGSVKNITFSNLSIKNTICPIVFNLYYNCCGGNTDLVSDKNFREFDEGTPTIKNILFNNIVATNVSSSAIYMFGLPESKISDIFLTNIIIEMDKNGASNYPSMMKDNVLRKQEGIYLNNVENVKITNLQLRGVIGSKVSVFNSKEVSY